mmetsp:Transcript_7659/g.19567  ORF Transcript_7659/g.19567 Transcript_7659/m.19567 type:complete len:371 (+) Transcript_7659:109-1221(+)
MGWRRARVEREGSGRSGGRDAPHAEEERGRASARMAGRGQKLKVSRAVGSRSRNNGKQPFGLVPGGSSNDVTRRRILRPSVNAVAGAAAGCLVSIFLHPIDTIKVLVQSRGGSGTRNPVVVLTNLVTRHGPRRLYSGISANLASSVPISAIYTSSYEAAKHHVMPFVGEKRRWLAHCIGGAVASVATSFVYTPSECVKNRVQAGICANSWEALIQVTRNEGPLALYRAWPAVLLRNVPQSILKFFAYEQMKQLILEHRKRDPTPLEMLLVGGVAGASAAIFTTPFDVIKTRMQTQVGVNALSLAGTFASIVTQDGIGGLYRGVLPRIVIYLSQGAIFFTGYEAIKPALENMSTQLMMDRPRQIRGSNPSM